MNMAEAKKVIMDAGIKVRDVETLKGSCKVQGLSVGEGSIRPTLYEKTIEDLDEIELIDLVERTMKNVPDVNIAVTKDKEFILAHSISCIRHRTDDNVAVTWPVYGDLEEFIRVYMGQDGHDNMMSFVVTKELLETSGLSLEEIRVSARKNLENSVRIQSMTEVLSSMMGSSMEDVDIPQPDELMYVASTESKVNGASVMLLEGVLNDFCKDHKLESVYIIPSSIHEVLLISSKMPIDQVNSMIREVNETQVDEWERLSDHVYTFVAN